MELQDIIYNFKPNNRKITNDTYIYKVKKLLDNNINLENEKEVKSYLEGFAYKTKRSYYIAIIVYMKALGKNPEFYEKCIKEMLKEIEITDKKNEATDKEKGNIVKREDIEKIIGNLEKNIEDYETKGKINSKYFRVLQNYLIINLYFLIPPIRNDYVIVDVYDSMPFFSNKDTNYMLLDDKTLIINRYKTDRKYGMITIKLPDKIVEIVKKVISRREEIFPILYGEKALLINANLVRMSKVNLIQNLNSIFKKKISVTMLRKSYISEKYPVEFTVEDMEKDANIMGHSVSLQQSTYRKK